MNTNLNKTKEEIMYELVLSLNNGNSGRIDERVHYAEQQYEALKNAGVIEEVRPPCDHEWKLISINNAYGFNHIRCTKCGQRMNVNMDENIFL